MVLTFFIIWRLSFVLFAPYVCLHILLKWPPIGKIGAHSAYETFS